MLGLSRGGQASNNNFAPLAMRWDGREWKQAPMPPVNGLLHGVTAIAPDDVWAVGNSYPDNENIINTLTMHWDGQGWSIVPSRANSGEFRGTYWFSSVAALSTDDVWAVGYIAFPRTAPMMLIEHWDGHTWSVVTPPVEQRANAESSIDGAANVAGELWLVGTYENAVALRYRRVPCSQLTPTPVRPLNPPVPLPGSGSRTFPETGKTVSGVFLRYWDEHGGLAQQGYPISEVIGEVSDLDGKVYTVQYFERAVFEWHPENRGTRYEVVLSHLGRFRWAEKYGDALVSTR